jgi:hypothetical protein
VCIDGWVVGWVGCWVGGVNSLALHPPTSAPQLRIPPPPHLRIQPCNLCSTTPRFHDRYNTAATATATHHPPPHTHTHTHAPLTSPVCSALPTAHRPPHTALLLLVHCPRLHCHSRHPSLHCHCRSLRHGRWVSGCRGVQRRGSG